MLGIMALEDFLSRIWVVVAGRSWRVDLGMGMGLGFMERIGKCECGLESGDCRGCGWWGWKGWLQAN
jgi:hypothetical protein